MEALWESKTADNANPEKRKLAKLTKVIMFFGTPHKGSDAATWAQIGTKVVAMAKLDALEHLSGSLKLDSEILNNVHSDFMKLLHGGAFYIHVFQEGRPMGKGMKKVYHSVLPAYRIFDSFKPCRLCPTYPLKSKTRPIVNTR